VPYVRVRFPDETWHAVKELARRELRRAPNQVVVLVQKALEELQMEEARRPALQGGEAAGPAEHHDQGRWSQCNSRVTQ
jgi:hypothetical protein